MTSRSKIPSYKVFGGYGCCSECQLGIVTRCSTPGLLGRLMSLLTPLALLLLAVAVPIVLMYVLRLRREDRIVPSIYLWRRAIEDVQANAPWQRLRPSLLLVLQLLVVLALVLALARPAYTQVRTYTGDVVVIVDESYAMQARDVAPSRFGAALEQAHRLSQQLTPGNVMSVIGMSAQPKLVLAESEDRVAIDRAIDGLQVGNTSTNFLASLSLASSLARSGESTRVVVLTSRDSGITALPIAVSFPVTLIRIGGQLRDLGITAFDAVHRGGYTQAVVTVRNFGVRGASSDLDLFTDGQLADVRPVRVDPGKEVHLFWTELPASVGRLEAKLAQNDDFVGDKAAWTVIPTEQTRSVLLVTSGSFFLQTALTIDPSVTLAVVRPEYYENALARSYDIVVFDHVLPQTLPSVSTLLISPPSGRVGSLRVGQERPAGAVSAVASPSASADVVALLKFVDFSDVHVARARNSELPSWVQPIAVSRGTPLIAAGDSGTVRLGLIAFDLQQSDWPLRISFPVTIQNLLHYLAPGQVVGASTVSVDHAVPLFVEAGVHRIDITRPDGTTDQVRTTSPLSGVAFYTRTDRPGFYLVREMGGARPLEASFAVDFFHPRSSPSSGARVLSLGRSHVANTRSTTVPIDLAWAMGLLALAFITAEWWFAFRR